MANIDAFRIDGTPSEKSPRILIVKLSSIGDVVMTTCVASVLRRYYPKAYIAWAVEKKSADMLMGNPYLDEVIVWPRIDLKHLGRLAQSLRDLRARKFDIALELQGLSRAALVAWGSGAKLRIGYSDAREGSAFTYNRPIEPTSDHTRVGEYYVRALRALGIENPDFEMEVPLLSECKTAGRGILESQGIGGEEPYAVLCPATTWPQKHWIEERWSEVADGLFDEHGLRSVILGGPADAAMAERIAERSKARPVIAVGRADLNTSSALVAMARLSISVDTGLFFMAIAHKTPVVGLFGPTITSHLTGEPLVTVIKHPHPCSPCRRNREICTEFDCMKDVQVDEVLTAARGRLGLSDSAK